MLSPAVLLQGRNLRPGLHCHAETLKPQVVTPQQVKRCLLEKRSQNTFYHDANKSFRDPLQENQIVRVRKEKRWVPATVVRHANNPQSYWVRLTNGYVVRRNRTQINTTREEGLQTSSRVGPNEPNRAIVSNREPNQAIVSNREPNRDIVSNREPNRAIVSNREPNRDIVSNREPNQAIVSNREPNRDIVSNREPNRDIVSNHEPNWAIVSNREPNRDIVSNREPNRAIV